MGLDRFLLLAVVPTVSHVINNWLLNYVNATTISMSILGEPVGASILAFFLLGERLNAMQMIGSMLVLFGVSVFLLQQEKTNSKRCGERTSIYAGIIIVEEKREVVILLFCFIPVFVGVLLPLKCRGGENELSYHFIEI